MTKLSFLIAGVQKGGTTALWHFLRQNPQIQFGLTKELHFFDDDSHDWSDPPYDILHESYAPAAPEVLRGDATPISTYWPPSLARIHAYNPRIKLIVCLRDPVARAYSHWRMEVARGLETLPFSDAIRSGRSRLQVLEENSPLPRIISYVERGFYAAQLDRIYERFASDQVLLLRQSDLKNDHNATLDRVCDFLRVQRFQHAPVAETMHSHDHLELPTMSAEDAAHLGGLYAADLARLRDEYGVTF